MTHIPLPKSFLEKILKPINRLTESCVLNITPSCIYSISASADNTVILYAKALFPKESEFVKEPIRLNIISIKRLLSGLECLGDNGQFSIELESNNIKCQSVDHETEEKTYFKYHLVDDSIVREAAVNINKISSLKFDTEFTISQGKLKQLMYGYSFTSDLTKIYFSTKEDKVYAEIDDKTLQNVDNITLVASSEYIGTSLEQPVPISMEVFKNLALCRNDIKVKINNQYKVFVFQNTEEESIELKYIISALVK
jgi:hypothetical protein